MRLRPVCSVVALVSVVSLGAGLSACEKAAGHSISDGSGMVELAPLSELIPVDDPTSYQGPTTAIIGGPSIPPLELKPEPKLPVTVTSMDSSGSQDVEVTDVSRIIPLSLTGSIGELVYAYGMADNIVGRDISTNFPGSDHIPVVTKDGHSIDAEGILALNPSLIITDGSVGPTDVVLQMRDAGIPVVTVQRAFNPQTSATAAQQVADAMGISDHADELIDSMSTAILEKEREVKGLLPADPGNLPRVAFLYIRGTAGVFYLFGEGSGIDSLIESVGAVDAAQEIGWVGEKPMTEEALIAMDPDVIVVMMKGLESVGGVDGLLEAQPSVALTTAGQNRRIIDVDDSILFASGTRMPDVIDGLARAIYAPDSLGNAE